jgi:hypothetical protein
MDVISEQQYRDQVIAERERVQGEAAVDYLTPALKLLHMIDPDETPDDETEFMVSNVAAFYDANRHNVTIIDRGATANPALSVQTLAHELVHAAQDRDVGFGRLYQSVVSRDNVNAMSALLEGEATAYGLLVDAKQLDIPKGAIDWRILGNWTFDIRNRVFAHDSPYRVATTELAYPLGGLYIATAYGAGGPLAVRRVYDNPPLSAARFMAGQGEPGDAPAAAWTCGLPAAPGGYVLQLGDELGALALYAFATRLAFTEVQAWESARLWTGDRFYVYSRPDDANALTAVWLLRSTDAQTTASLQDALARASWAKSIRTAIRGDTLHVLATSSPLAQRYVAWTGCDPL